MLTVDDVIANIPGGMALLDSRREEGWDLHIDLDTLDLYGYRTCVLGQTYGNYCVGREALGIPFGCGEQYGFDLTSSEDGDWERLTQAWIDALMARRN